LYPATVEELACQERATLCCVAAAPAPVSDSTAGELPALLTKESFPVALPELLGEKITPKETLLPAAMVSGKETPVTVNSGLVVDAEETTTLDPAALSVADMVLLDPTATLPRSPLAGETFKLPLAVALPESGMVNVFPPPPVTTVRLPVAAPLVVGVNHISNVMLLPGANITGGAIPVLAKPVPPVLTDEIVNASLPPLVRVSKTLPLPPADTLPKLTLEGLAETFADIPER